MPIPSAREPATPGTPTTRKLEDTKDDYERLAAPNPTAPLVEFLERLDMGGLDLTRESDFGREVAL